MPRKHKVLLVVEDNPGDVRLIKEALRESALDLTILVAADGYQALEQMSHWEKENPVKKPDLIFLDLNLPRLSGGELLVSLKGNMNFRKIPVVIFSSSQAEDDILDSYQKQANCYITKPLELESYLDVIQRTVNFWFDKASLPPDHLSPGFNLP
jgi:CheY-like chemotaxis protein